MRGARDKGLNKEKLVFGLSVVLLAACTLVVCVAQGYPQSAILWAYQGLFGSVPPAPLVDRTPVTSVTAPTEYRVATGPIYVPPENMGRATPFAPVREEEEKKKQEGGKMDGKNGPDMTQDKRDTPNPKQTTCLQPDGPSRLDGNSPVAYMGVLGLRGERYGMLRVRSGKFLNVREGDVVTDLGIKVIRVEKESIHLQIRNGIYHILQKTGS